MVITQECDNSKNYVSISDVSKNIYVLTSAIYYVIIIAGIRSFWPWREKKFMGLYYDELKKNVLLPVIKLRYIDYVMI